MSVVAEIARGPRINIIFPSGVILSLSKDCPVGLPGEKYVAAERATDDELHRYAAWVLTLRPSI